MKYNQKIMKWVPIVAVILLLTLVVSNTSAQEPLAEGENETLGNNNKLTLFLGNTQDGSENGFSTGLEYEYQWSRIFGAGAMFEYAGGDHDAWVVGIPIFMHPHAGWYFLLMPGVEIEEEENSFLVRTGLGYDFKIAPKWSLTPEFNVDWIEGGDSKLIYGLSVVREF